MNEYLIDDISNIDILPIMKLINLYSYLRLTLKIALNLHQIIIQILYLMIVKD